MDFATALSRQFWKNFQFFQHLKKTNQGAIAYFELSYRPRVYGMFSARPECA